MSNLIESMIHENVQFSESKKVKESIDLRDNIGKSLHTVEQDAQGVYEGIMRFKESVRRVLWYINRADLSETEYSEYLRRLINNMYMYKETMYKLKDTSSELGRINQALLGFSRGAITIEDLMREI